MKLVKRLSKSSVAQEKACVIIKALITLQVYGLTHSFMHEHILKRKLFINTILTYPLELTA